MKQVYAPRPFVVLSQRLGTYFFLLAATLGFLALMEHDPQKAQTSQAAMLAGLLAVLPALGALWRVRLELDDDGLRVFYPFSLGLWPQSLRWSEVLAVELSPDAKQLFVVGQGDVLGLHLSQWNGELRAAIEQYRAVSPEAFHVDASLYAAGPPRGRGLHWLALAVVPILIALQPLFMDDTVHPANIHVAVFGLQLMTICMPLLVLLVIRHRRDPRWFEPAVTLAGVIAVLAGVLLWGAGHAWAVRGRPVAASFRLTTTGTHSQFWTSADGAVRITVDAKAGQHFAYTDEGHVLSLPVLAGPFGIQDVPRASLALLRAPGEK